MPAKTDHGSENTLPSGTGSTPAQPPNVPIGTRSPHLPSTQVSPWSRLHLWQIQPLRDAILLAAIFGLLWLGYRLSIVTVPVLLALMLAYLFEPLVKKLTRGGRVSRNFVAVIVIIIAASLVVVPAAFALTFGAVQGTAFAERQLSNVQKFVRSVDDSKNPALREQLPVRWRSLRDYVVGHRAKAQQSTGAMTLPGVAPDRGTAPNATGAPLDAIQDLPTDSTPAPTSGEPRTMRAGLKDLVAQGIDHAVTALGENSAEIGKRAVRLGTDLAGGLFTAAGTLATLAFSAFLTAFFFFFFCTGWGRVLRFWEGLIPEKRKGRVFHLASRMDRVIAGFVRGRLTICLIQMVFFTLAYWAIGVPAPLIVGPMVGLLTLVPYAAGLAVPVVIALLWLGPTHDAEGVRGGVWWVIGAPVVVQAVSQVLDDYVLSPTIQGKSTDMSMPLILFASIAGGVLAGFYGLLIAIPVAACLKILFEELVLPRIKAWASGRAADPLPIDP